MGNTGQKNNKWAKLAASVVGVGGGQCVTFCCEGLEREEERAAECVEHKKGSWKKEEEEKHYRKRQTSRMTCLLN